MNYLIMDIETIPRTGLNEALESEIQRKVEQKLKARPGDPDEMESLVRSTSPFFGQVLCMGLRWYNDGHESVKDHVICKPTELETLTDFFNIINSGQIRGVRFVHYNGMGFDIPFLLVRAIHHGIAVTNQKFMNLRRFTFDHHVDLMMYLANWSTYNAVSLDVVCQSMGIPSPKEGDVKGNSVAAAFEAGNIAGVEEYVLRDVEATYQLFRKIKPYLV